MKERNRDQKSVGEAGRGRGRCVVSERKKRRERKGDGERERKEECARLRLGRAQSVMSEERLTYHAEAVLYVCA